MRATLAALLFLLSLSPARAAEDPAALDALLDRLRQPVPASTPFVERRGSALLSEPLLLSGRLERPDEDTLLRVVEAPYRERSTIRDGRVELEREGESTRRFSLRRAPELAALLDSFRALLGGQRALLEKHYTVRLSGNPEAGWQLSLTPREARRRQRVRGIDLFGRGALLDCLVVHDGEGQSSPMLLGAAAGGPTGSLAERFAGHCAPPPSQP
ncbi:LolA-related protein [Pseudomarimonas salicorniae]|uniref:Fatty acyl CoA synthetase n=1 Tax=Pseudomarimonas salicorniae TaxID=2933270 RepID=A0ABT0GED0_9GAMM|nr:LolA-related protein [Lysobacter sp. CAU 1642]MCK7592365.1 fatty acyl CoA synthetase [Lysobacter sp. CAU 1642]